MNVELISKPNIGALQVCELAAAVCTNSQRPARALSHALRSGHDSVAEHAFYTFHIKGVSRVLLAQLTRHRIASYSVMSQRYVKQTDAKIVVPASIENSVYYDNFMSIYGEIQQFYDEMISNGIPAEDARYILPNGVETELFMTMNARELGHFITLRTCNRAQAEIRELAEKVLALVKEDCPELFSNAGPNCVRGHCQELKPCGHPRMGEL